MRSDSVGTHFALGRGYVERSDLGPEARISGKVMRSSRRFRILIASMRGDHELDGGTRSSCETAQGAVLKPAPWRMRSALYRHRNREAASGPVQVIRAYRDDRRTGPEPWDNSHPWAAGGHPAAERVGRRLGPLQGRRVPPTGDQAPDQKDDHGAHDRADQPCALSRAIPSDGLPEVGRDDGPDDSQDRRENEARR